MSENFVCRLTFGPSGLIHVINRLSYKQSIYADVYYLLCGHRLNFELPFWIEQLTADNRQGRLMVA
jgi:hypothetical protein